MTTKSGVAAIVVMVAGAGLLAAPVPAQTSDTAQLNAIAACGTIEKKSARLACYDAQSRGATISAGAPQASSAPAPMVGQAATAVPSATQTPQYQATAP